MAKTTRASMARRLKFTPELLADVKRRFEETDEPLSSMAGDLGCCKTTLRAIAAREGWVRYEAPPRDLSPAARLRERAEALSLYPPTEFGLARVRQIDDGRNRVNPISAEGEGRSAERSEGERGGVTCEERSPPPGNSREATVADLPPPGGGEEREPGGAKPTIPTPAQVRATIADIYAGVRKELADYKAYRDALDQRPLGLLERERLARTFAHLSATAQRLQGMLAALDAGHATAATSHNETAYDDMPADLDEFRNELARQIDALLAEPPDGADSAQAAAADAAAPEA